MLRTTRYDVVDAKALRYVAQFAGSFKETEAMVPQIRAYERRATITGDRAYIPVNYVIKTHRLFIEDGTGIQRLPRPVRNRLLPPGSIDLDFANCAPVILRGVCRLFDIHNTPMLDWYVLNHKTLCRAIGQDTKLIKSAILFGPDDVLHEVGERPLDGHRGNLEALVTELRDVIVLHLKDKPELNPLWLEAKEADEKKKELHEAKRSRPRRAYRHNSHGIFLSYVYFRYETRALEAMDAKGVEMELWANHVSFVFDGMVVQPRAPIGDDQLRQLGDAVMDAVGIGLQVVVKPLEPVLVIDINTLPQDLVITEDEDESGHLFALAMRGKVVKCEKNLFAKVNGVWTDYDSVVDAFLTHEALSLDIKKLVFNKMTGEYDRVNYSKVLRHAQAMKTAAEHRHLRNDFFSRDMVLSSHHKLAFPNGTWEFLPARDPVTGMYGRFQEGVFFDTGVMMEYPWEPPVQAEIDEVMRRLIDPVFDGAEPGLKDNYLLSVSRAMAGEVDKLTNLLEGSRNSSKSMQMQGIKAAFGMYVRDVPSGIFLVRPNSSQDAFAENKWVFDLEHARIAVMSEKQQQDLKGETVFSGDKLKSFQSMKEGIPARRMRCNPRTVHSIATGFMLVNDMPEFQPADSIKDCHVYRLTNQFVDAATKARSPFTPGLKLRDPSIEDFVRSPQCKRGLMHIVLAAYRPERVVPTPSMQEIIDDIGDKAGDGLWDSVLEFTLDFDDKVAVDDIHKAIRPINPTMAFRSVSRDVRKLLISRLAAAGLPIQEDYINNCRIRRGGRNTKLVAIPGVRLVVHDVDGGGGDDNGFAEGFMP